MRFLTILAMLAVSGVLFAAVDEPTNEGQFIVSSAVEKFLLSSGDKENETMLVALPIRELRIADTEETVHEAVIVGGESFSSVNGRFVTSAEIDQMVEARRLKTQREREERISWRRYAMDEFARRMSFAPDRLREDYIREATTINIALTAAQIQNVIKNCHDLFLGVEEYNAVNDNMAEAMVDTSVDPYVLDYSARHGDGVGIYQSENCCPDSGFVTNYYKIASTCTTEQQEHSKRVAGIIRDASPDGFLYCRNGCVVPTSTDLAGYSGNPPIHIVNLSCSGGNDSSAYNTLSRDFDNLVYDEDVAVFASAGNCGDDEEFDPGEDYVGYPAEGLNVIAVGSYNDATDYLSPFTSWRNSVVNNEKPDITAPGVNISSGGYGNASGTSLAAPHAAAIAADFAGYYTWLKFKPHYINAMTIATSTDSILGDWWKKGVGGIDFQSGFFDGYTQSWEGSNSSWSTFDNADPYPGNGYIDKTFYVNASYSMVRVAIYWLNDGDYIYSHQNDSYVIGMDLDFEVYDPNGDLVNISSSYENPWEVLTFDPAISGNYRVKIIRASNRDTACNIRLGLWINLNS